MYINKQLGGVQCVQTLSRLNRTTKGKTKTFILDFVNDTESIKTFFKIIMKLLFWKERQIKIHYIIL